MKRIKWYLFGIVGALLSAQPALAEAAAGGGSDRGLIALAAGLGLGIAAFGAATGQGRAASSAMESIGRNPNSAASIQGQLIVSLAFMEALGLLAFIIAILLNGKV